LFNRDYEPCLNCITLREELIKAEVRESKECESCNILKLQIARLESQNQQLFDRLLRLSEPEVIPVNTTFTPAKPKAKTWDLQRKELEAQDRITSKTLKDIADLEKELEINKEEDKSA